MSYQLCHLDFLEIMGRFDFMRQFECFCTMGRFKGICTVGHFKGEKFWGWGILRRVRSQKSDALKIQNAKNWMNNLIKGVY